MLWDGSERKRYGALLCCETYLVAGAIGAGGVQSIAHPGSLPIMWLGENRTNARFFRNYIKIIDAGYRMPLPGTPTDSLKDGFIVRNGRYWTGCRVDDSVCLADPDNCRPAIRPGVYYGLTSDPLYVNGGITWALSRVYHSAIINLLDVSANSIPESTIHTFGYPIADGPPPPPTWKAYFRGRDIDGGGFGQVNPLDLLTKTSVNDSLDGLSAGLSFEDIGRLNTLHELGHAIGMGPLDKFGVGTHSNTGPSPMRIGHGPDKVANFSTLDKSEFRLK